MESRISSEHVYDYLLSGRVHANFYNILTNNQLHVNINRKNASLVWYVYAVDKSYLGYIRGDVFIWATPGSGFVSSNGKLAMQRFSWIWKQIVAKTIPDTMYILHDGSCGHCGRTLSDATSLKVGIGPSCRKKLGIVYSSQTQLEL
jgi:hypothetical protein